MANVVEQAVEEALAAVKNDVTETVKNHPQYAEIVKHLAEQAVQQLIASVA